MAGRTMNCPHCDRPIDPSIIRRDAARQAGSRGKGRRKARSSAQARAAALARWKKRPAVTTLGARKAAS